MKNTGSRSTQGRQLRRNFLKSDTLNTQTDTIVSSSPATFPESSAQGTNHRRRRRNEGDGGKCPSTSSPSRSRRDREKSKEPRRTKKTTSSGSPQRRRRHRDDKTATVPSSKSRHSSQSKGDTRSPKAPAEKSTKPRLTEKEFTTEAKSADLIPRSSMTEEDRLKGLSAAERKAIARDKAIRKKLSNRGWMSDSDSATRTPRPMCPVTTDALMPMNGHKPLKSNPNGFAPTIPKVASQSRVKERMIDPRHQAEMNFSELFSDEEQYKQFKRGSLEREPPTKERKKPKARVIIKAKQNLKLSKSNSLEIKKIQDPSAVNFEELSGLQGSTESSNHRGMMKTLSHTFGKVGKSTQNVAGKGAKSVGAAGGTVAGAVVSTGGAMVSGTRKGAMKAGKATKAGAHTAGVYTAKQATALKKKIHDLTE